MDKTLEQEFHRRGYSGNYKANEGAQYHYLSGKWNKNHNEGLPGGAVVKSPPPSAGDTGSSPGPGRSHMPLST